LFVKKFTNFKLNTKNGNNLYIILPLKFINKKCLERI
jgi:hypothetical protein